MLNTIMSRFNLGSGEDMQITPTRVIKKRMVKSDVKVSVNHSNIKMFDRLTYIYNRLDRFLSQDHLRYPQDVAIQLTEWKTSLKKNETTEFYVCMKRDLNNLLSNWINTPELRYTILKDIKTALND